MRFSRKGFSILEVLLAILLLGTGFAILLQILNMGLFATSVDENEIIALNLLQEKVEALRNTAYSSISDESKAAVTGFPAFSRQVAVTIPQSGLKQISVTVYWYAKSDEMNKSVVTYVSEV